VAVMLKQLADGKHPEPAHVLFDVELKQPE
jgi:hypothetical protein